MTIQSEQVEIKYTSLDGTEHSAFIWPLKRKEGVKILHTLITTIGGAAISGDLVSMIKAIDYDALINILTPLLRYAVIDGKECKELDTFDGFNGRFTDIYIIGVKALEVNYPDFFGLLKSGDSIASIPGVKV